MPLNHHRHRILRCVLLGMLSITSFWLGTVTPSYFRSVSTDVIQSSGVFGNKPSVLAKQFLQDAQPGLAQAMARHSRNSQKLIQLENEIAQLINEEPLLFFAGGTDAFFYQFLKAAPNLRSGNPAVIPNLIYSENRSVLRGFLNESLKSSVKEILTLDQLSGWQIFLPAYSDAGQPLDATILVTALLEQSGAFSTGLQNQLQVSMKQSIGDNNVAGIEKFLLGILRLGSHLDWEALKTVVSTSRSVNDLHLASISIDEERSKETIISALSVADSPSNIYRFLQQFPESGIDDMRWALSHSDDSLNSLLKLQKPLFHAPQFWKLLPEVVSQSPEILKRLAANSPLAAIFIRGLAFLVCGYCLVEILRLVVMKSPCIDRQKNHLIKLDSSTGGVLLTIFLWILIEPGLLHFPENEEGSLVLNFASVLPSSNATNSESNKSMIDQVTIIVLLFFFLMQLLVFIFSLVKITEIKHQKVHPEVKLKLLDNEENLFDLGLYVGLGGTVFSLILVVLKLVDASLMAAYASTLFGIIFVATLKIAFLRPFKKSLILSANPEQ